MDDICLQFIFSGVSTPFHVVSSEVQGKELGA
jgi:hypothetical protein